MGRAPRVMLGVLALEAVLVLFAARATALDGPDGPALVGFSFSPWSVSDGQEPAVELAALLDRLHPDLVRLPVYWEDVGAEVSSLDYSEVDTLLGTIAQHNAQNSSPITRVVLVVGVRNFGFPEIHAPTWVGYDDAPVQRILKSAAYIDYLDRTFTRYASNPYLYAWQVENEPLDNIHQRKGGPTNLSKGQLAQEIRQVRTIDPGPPVIVSTFNSSTLELDQEGAGPLGFLYRILPGAQPVGHPSDALGLADVLGFDAYVATPETKLDDASIDQRIAWKADALTYWALSAQGSGKQVWIAEMQASPWTGTLSFETDDLLHSAQAYRRTGVSAVLFYGVEYWMASPGWLKAGEEATQILRN